VATALKEARPDGKRNGRGGELLATAANVLGMTEAELKTALSDDKSIASVASDKKINLQKVIDALIAEQNARIDKSATDGRLTQAEADARKAKTVERVTAMVNDTRPKGGPRGGGHRGGERGMKGNPLATSAA